MTGIRPSRLAAQVRVYAPPRHPAPCDLDLASGVGPAPADALIAEALVADPPNVAHYPDASSLARLLARRFRVTEERVLVTAGADDALQRALRAALGPGRRAVLTAPTFEMLPRFAWLAEGDVTEVAWSAGPLPVTAMLAAAGDDVTAIVVVSPNNPTGLVASAADLAAIAAARPDVLLVVDLAYVEFAADDPTEPLLAYPNVVTTRTFSKAWGLAGTRVGYALGPPKWIARLRAVGLPYPTSRVSLALAERVMRHGEERMRSHVEHVRGVRSMLAGVLASCGAPSSPSQANFVCTTTPRAAWLHDALAGLGIRTRHFPGMCIRIGVPGDGAAWRRLEHGVRTALAPEALLFDMDGVLADVSRSYRAAIVATARRFGASVAPADIQAAKARGDANDDWSLTRDLLASRGVDVPLPEVIDCFESLYHGTATRDGLARRETLIPSRELLDRLSRRVPLAVVTGRPRADALRFLEIHDLSRRFATVVAREDGPLKPDPTPVRCALARLGIQRAWLIGDTPDDVRAARSAGVVPLGFLQPPERSPRMVGALTAAGMARRLDTLEDLEALLP